MITKAALTCAMQNKASKKYFLTGPAGVWYFALSAEGFSAGMAAGREGRRNVGGEWPWPWWGSRF